ncbi:MAG: NAD(P)H-dependent oxidoreductase subunit E [Gemmatimonadota bacterium]
MSEHTNSSSNSSSSSKNPGWAGETGEFPGLSEADVRGTEYVGAQPKEGWQAGGINAYPYQIAEKQSDAPLFEGPYGERLDRILSRYPTKRAALLPVLNLAQEIHGHVSAADMEKIAQVLELEPATVRGVATFYTMYNKAPVGRYLIQVCTNIACTVCGGDDVFNAFLEHTGTEPGATSEDGDFTVMEVECLGACGFPTVVQINNRYFENVNAEDVPAILDRLKEHGVDPIGSDGRGSAAKPDSVAKPDSAADSPPPASNSNSNANSNSGEEG